MLQARDTEVNFFVRAKYYITPEGVTKLAKVQHLSYSSFRLPGFEAIKRQGHNPELDRLLDEEEEEAAASSSAISALYDESLSYELLKDDPEAYRTAWKSLHRAKMNAFDKILCNPDLDTFATLTISPEYVNDRASWEDVYKRLKIWLSDRVQRRGLKYVICPERHKLGGIHFHALFNSSALRLTPATNAHTGAPLYHNGQPLWNIQDFPFGFTSAEIVRHATVDREKVAKYIFKYMGKQGVEGKIGGRYVLTGGDLKRPIYLYGNDPTEFIPISEDEARESGFYREADHEGIRYREWSFI